METGLKLWILWIMNLMNLKYYEFDSRSDGKRYNLKQKWNKN